MILGEISNMKYEIREDTGMESIVHSTTHISYSIFHIPTAGGSF